MSAEIDQIDVTPTKRFFVDMFTRDIPLEQAILDLVDNSIDGAQRQKTKGKKSLDGYWVEIKFSGKEFKITDNCGGFSRKTARDYAFRFGRPEDHKPTDHSIGQFGVGMKRALFKFGSHFIVKSATSKDEWAIDVNVEEWIKTDEWAFPWSTFKSKKISKEEETGTEIIVKNLRPEVSTKFSTDRFSILIVQLIKSKHRQFIADGLSVIVNGSHVDATSIFLLQKDSLLRPGVDNLIFPEKGKADVKARIIVAVGESSPRDAGWYVIGNGRVILEADRRPETGWGALEDGRGKVLVPFFHNQFARFRGIISFDSNDSSRIPWNTSKSDVDKDNPVWQVSLRHMIEMMRPVITFLNELDADIDEHGRQHSPMLNLVDRSKREKVEAYTKKAQFSAPSKEYSKSAPKTVLIRYSKPTKDVEFLKDQLGVSSAAAVGEKTFDLILAKKK